MTLRRPESKEERRRPEPVEHPGQRVPGGHADRREVQTVRTTFYEQGLGPGREQQLPSAPGEALGETLQHRAPQVQAVRRRQAGAQQSQALDPVPVSRGSVQSRCIETGPQAFPSQMSSQALDGPAHLSLQHAQCRAPQTGQSLPGQRLLVSSQQGPQAIAGDGQIVVGLVMNSGQALGNPPVPEISSAWRSRAVKERAQIPWTLRLSAVPGWPHGGNPGQGPSPTVPPAQIEQGRLQGIVQMVSREDPGQALVRRPACQGLQAPGSRSGLAAICAMGWWAAHGLQRHGQVCTEAGHRDNIVICPRPQAVVHMGRLDVRPALRRRRQQGHRITAP